MHFKDDTRVRFLWIGDGELRNEIQENEQVQVTGWVTPNEVQHYLNQIDVYISTSLWEGLPLSVLEAMNCGKPLLLSDCVGNVDTVKMGTMDFYIMMWKRQCIILKNFWSCQQNLFFN